jgi:23S rRNA (adenine(2503)-C(2))-methyltransferase
MNIFKLEQKIKELKLPAFRANQIKRAFYHELKNGWNEAATLPKELREKMAKELEWDNIRLESQVEDKQGGAVKATFKLKDGSIIESVLIRHKDGRNTVCVSSQAGCPLACVFCATGSLGFKRNLESPEIADQVIYFARQAKKINEKISNVVFMGMGEPLLNYGNVIEAVRILNAGELFGLGARHISISTIGIIDGIRKLADEPYQVNLAFSLHAPDERLRSKLIPANRSYPLKKIMPALDEYITKTGRRVMVEYLMIDKVNDGEEQVLGLIELLKGRKLYYLNLIRYNRTDNYDPSPDQRIGFFMDKLIANGISVTKRHSFGNSILGACGQLGAKSIDKKSKNS